MDTVTVLMPGAAPTDWARTLELLKFIAPAALVILSAYLAYAFARRQAKMERAKEFLLRQVTDLYSPLVGIHSRIRSLSQLRAEVEGLASEAWSKSVDSAPKSNPEFSEHLKREFVPFDKLIEYNNRQLREELLPLYERMLSLLGDHLWLAEPSTVDHQHELTKFVELWRRNLDDSLPPEVLSRVKHSETSLHPFYEDIRRVLTTLSGRLRSGRAI